MKSGNNTKTRSRTDWKRIDALQDKDIDYSDIPKQGPDFFANAILWPGPKSNNHIGSTRRVLTVAWSDLCPMCLPSSARPAKAIRPRSMPF